MPKHTDHQTIVKATSHETARSHAESESAARTGHNIDKQRIQNTGGEAAAYSDKAYMQHVDRKSLTLQQEHMGETAARESAKYK